MSGKSASILNFIKNLVDPTTYKAIAIILNKKCCSEVKTITVGNGELVIS